MERSENLHSSKMIDREQRLELVPRSSQKLRQGRQLLLLCYLAHQIDKLRDTSKWSVAGGSAPVRPCDHRKDAN